MNISIPALDKLSYSDNSDLDVVQSMNPFISLCVPSTCSYQDVETHMNVALEPLNGSARLTPRSCSTRYPEPWETQDYVAIYIISGIVGLVVLTSFYDFLCYRNSKVKSAGLLSSFSLYTNVQKLSTKTDNKEISSINGLRFFAVVTIVIGHRYVFNLLVPFFNFSKTEISLQHWTMAPLHNVMLGVEVFLVLSGLLVTYNFFKSMEDNKTFNIPKFYFRRYMRITPVFFVMMIIHGIIFYHMSDGPLWKRLTGVHKDMCADNWWPSLLYISNYYNKVYKMCVPQSWYLNTDMQLYLISPLLLIPLHKKPKFGLSLIFGCFVATIAASYFNAEYYGLKSGGSVTITRRNMKNLNEEYTKTHTRAASYFMGLALGYFVYKYKQGMLKVNLSKATLVIGWLVAAVTILGVTYSIVYFQQMDVNPPQYVDSLYLALHRPIFSIGIVWIIFVSVTGYGGAVNRILSLRIFKPLSTLTYGIYMSHLILQVYDVGRSRLPYDVNTFDVIQKGSADVLGSIFFSLILFLTVEAPFEEVYKWFFPKSDKKEDAPAPVESSEKTHF